jgi:hypothetical protein
MVLADLWHRRNIVDREQESESAKGKAQVGLPGLSYRVLSGFALGGGRSLG